MDNASLADRLVTALAITRPPVALAGAELPPAGAAVVAHPLPSACAFWVAAEHGTVFAAAEDHANCPVGALVMGLPMSAATQARLGELVAGMAGCGYLGTAEASAIPTRASAPSGVVYGRLADFPLAPEAVLVWIAPAQAMVWAEAAGAVAWGAASQSPITGRPACAAIPAALAAGRPVLSFGCIGMRTFTGLPDDRLLGVIPGAALEAFVARLEQASAANIQMAAFYRRSLTTFMGEHG